MKKKIVGLEIAFILIIFSVYFLSATEYSNEVSSDFVISSEKANIIKPTETSDNSGFLISALIIIILTIFALIFNIKKAKKKIKKR